MKLKIADGLTLPIEVAGQTIGLVGIRGSGKTNTAGVIAEELLDRNHRIAVIDPTDAWWGLRSGYPVYIFGGPHGDVPLAETDGKVLAEFVVTEQVPLILSLRHLRKGAQRRFVTEFCEELYHLKGRDEYRSPLTVFIDEAPLFVPQKVLGEVARTVGAVEDLIARGRNSGFGVVLISQRPATINKDVLTQADTIITHRLTSPQDRKALAEWVEENATLEQMRDVLASLATMPNGDAWVWAPRLDVMKRVHIRLRRTFDSSASPKIGEKLAPPKQLTAIDFEKLKGKLAATIERAKADDPKELRQRISVLERELKRRKATPAPAVPERVEVPVLLDEDRGRIDGLVQSLQEFSKSAANRADEISGSLARVVQSLQGREMRPPYQPARKPVHEQARESIRPRVAKQFGQVDRSVNSEHSRRVADSNGNLTGPEQRILDAIAWLAAIGVAEPEQPAVAFLAGYTFGGGAFNNPRGALRTKGLVDYVAGERIRLTDAGDAAANRPDVPLTPKDLQACVLRRLPGPEQRLLRPLLDAYPNALTNEDLASQAGYTPNAGAFNNPRGRLRSLGLIEYPRPGHVVARPLLFLEDGR